MSDTSDRRHRLNADACVSVGVFAHILSTMGTQLYFLKYISIHSGGHGASDMLPGYRTACLWVLLYTGPEHTEAYYDPSNLMHVDERRAVQMDDPLA